MAAPLLPFDEHDREQLLDLSVQQRSRLLAGIRALTGVSSHDAEDLLQDVWVAFLERGVSTEPESWFALIRTAAKNLHIDHVRRAARAERAAGRVPVPTWLAPNRDSVTESLAFRTLLLDALTDLELLPAKERRAFVLRYYDDLRPAAIAEQMGLLTTQVDELLRQAKERLAKAQESRKGSRAYMLLAAILRPASDRADAAASPFAGMATVAATVALSLVTVVPGGVPPTVHPAPTSAPQHHAATPPRPVSRASSGPSLSVRDVVGASRADQVDPARASSDRRVTPHLHVPPTCTEHLCIGTGPHGTGRPGDTVTVTIAGRDVYATETVIPVCEHVPTTSTPSAAIRCDRQEPDEWRVKDVPPAPSHGGPP